MIGTGFTLDRYREPFFNDWMRAVVGFFAKVSPVRSWVVALIGGAIGWLLGWIYFNGIEAPTRLWPLGQSNDGSPTAKQLFSVRTWPDRGEGASEISYWLSEANAIDLLLRSGTGDSEAAQRLADFFVYSQGESRRAVWWTTLAALSGRDLSGIELWRGMEGKSISDNEVLDRLVELAMKEDWIKKRSDSLEP